MKATMQECVDEGWFMDRSELIRCAIRHLIRRPDAMLNHPPSTMVTGSVTAGPRAQARSTATLNDEIGRLVDEGYGFNKSQLIRSAIYSLVLEYRDLDGADQENPVTDRST